MRTLRWMAGIIVLVFFASCDRYDLELYYNGAADVDISYDWLSRFGEHPEGMTLLIAHDGDSIGYADISNEVDRTQMPLLSGEHRLTAMNRSFSEYSTMNFYQRNSHDGLFAQSNMWIVRSAYAWDDGTRYLEEPEYIGVATDTIVIPKTIDDLVFYDYRGHAEADTLHESRKEVIMPMTTTLHISCRVVNIQYMRSVEGFITGMADGFLLNHVWRRTETGLLKLSNWTTDSIIHIDVQTFGLPHGRELLQQRQPEHNYLRLHFTLIDGSSMDCDYYVGKLVHYEHDDGTLQNFAKEDVGRHLYLVIDQPGVSVDDLPTLPYAQPEGTGQFDADVNPWVEGNQVDIRF